MKASMILLNFLPLYILGAIPFSNPHTIEGLWISENKQLIIEFKKEAELYNAYVYKSETEKYSEGDLFFEDFLSKDGKKFIKGKMNTKKGVFEPDITLEENILKIKISKGFLSKTLSWERYVGH